MKRRAAHFLLVPELAGSPPNDTIVRTLQEMGFAVDLFAPGDIGPVPYATAVGRYPASFCRRWLVRHALASHWRQYAVFSGTSEDPLAVAGVLSLVHRRPMFALVDEIKSGSYAGNAPETWKSMCKWAMRRAAFCIVNDESRIDLLRDYAGLAPASDVLVYPGAFHDPPEPGDRSALRTAWGMPDDALVIGVSGGFNAMAGADWLIDALRRMPQARAVLQAPGLDPFARLLLRNLNSADRIYVEQRRLGWREAWASAVGFDVGLAIYTNPAPQFQRMGISSNRLCMFLCMGVPVIASRQPSFDFLERYGCGVLVDSQKEFDAALLHIGNNLATMKHNALRCAREYIAAPRRRAELQSRLARLLG